MNSEDPIDKLIARFLHLFLLVNLDRVEDNRESFESK
jgi:hypothetical protein